MVGDTGQLKKKPNKTDKMELNRTHSLYSTYLLHY